MGFDQKPAPPDSQPYYKLAIRGSKSTQCVAIILLGTPLHPSKEILGSSRMNLDLLSYDSTWTGMPLLQSQNIFDGHQRSWVTFKQSTLYNLEKYMLHSSSQAVE